MSHTLTQTDIPAAIAARVQLTRLDPRDVMEMLEARGWRRVYVDGGRVVQSFLRAGLIADMILTRAPVLIGDGIALFGALPGHTEFEHLDTRWSSSGLVTSRYRTLHRAREQPSPQ